MKEKVKMLIENKGKLLLLQPIGKDKFTLIGGGVGANESMIDAGIREAFEEAGLVLTHADFRYYYVSLEEIKGKSTLFYCFIVRGGNVVFELKEQHKFQRLDWVPIKKGLSKLKGIEKKAGELLVAEYLKSDLNFKLKQVV